MFNMEPDVFDMLVQQGFKYDVFWDTWFAKDITQHISANAVRLYPGDVRYYLETGFIRNIKIFDMGFIQPTAKDLGMKAHRDGRPVQMRRVK